ncbi:MAG: SDR family oxidoreductase [Bacteroidota bacterium]
MEGSENRKPNAERDQLLRALQQYADAPELANDDDQLKGLIAKIYKNARKQRRKESAGQIKSADLQKKSQSELFRTNDEFQKGKQESQNFQPEQLQRSQKCYCCKVSYREVHFFYHRICPECAAFNYAYRSLTCDLTGYKALLTGGRIKIGFETALKLLRSGCEVYTTTRFPNDALKRYAGQHDYSEWKDRLFIYGLDLRNIPEVRRFIAYLSHEVVSLDIIINNAAQTIKRPLAFYRELIAGEQKNFLLESHKESLPSVGNVNFPQGVYDKHDQQVDLRPANSWSSKLTDVGVEEMLEIQLVNVTAPFLLNAGLKPLLKHSSNDHKFIVNVSAMEGQFNRENKTVFHPHTNMAKAALNMMTRTSAEDYARDGIYMTSVDTGWITDENPAPKREKLRSQGFVPPLDVIDGASRVFAPIADGINNPESIQYGVFLKDYKTTDW